MAAPSRPRVSLREVASDAERREWAVVADGAEVGRLAARRDGARAVVAYEVDGAVAHAVLRQALGRLVGSPPFDDTTVLVAEVSATDTGARRLLDETGFERVSVDQGARETWERGAGMRPRTGPERFLDRHGRIVQYPVRDPDMHELLVAILPRILSPGEVLTEAEINERIRPLTDDVALLRRSFVDHELVERTMSGTEYALVADVDNS